MATGYWHRSATSLGFPDAEIVMRCSIEYDGWWRECRDSPSLLSNVVGSRKKAEVVKIAHSPWYVPQ